MSRILSDILQAPEPDFSHKLRDWEQASGRSGHDIRLASEIALSRKQAIDSLGLDVNDTTSRELFYALRERATTSNHELEAFLGITEDMTVQQVISKVLVFIDSMTINRDVWVLKQSTIKQFLKKLPPKRLMKILGLRSIDSVLKRINASELLALSMQLETAEWTNKAHVLYKKFTPSDFQSTKSKVVLVDQDRIEKLHDGGYALSKIIVPNYETGTIIIVAPKARFQLDTLAVTLSILETLYNLRVYSAYFRHISVNNMFARLLYLTTINGLPGGLHTTQIGWKALNKHFNAQPESFDAIEQPHLQIEDINLTTPIQALQMYIPTFTFWNNNEHVIMSDISQPVSLHLMDVVVNSSNHTHYESSTFVYAQNSLWDTLVQRYLAHQNIQNEVLVAIDNMGLNES